MPLRELEINKLLFRDDLDGKESIDSSSSDDEFNPVCYEEAEPAVLAGLISSGSDSSVSGSQPTAFGSGSSVSSSQPTASGE